MKHIVNRFFLTAAALCAAVSSYAQEETEAGNSLLADISCAEYIQMALIVVCVIVAAVAVVLCLGLGRRQKRQETLLEKATEDMCRFMDERRQAFKELKDSIKAIKDDIEEMKPAPVSVAELLKEDKPAAEVKPEAKEPVYDSKTWYAIYSPNYKGFEKDYLNASRQADSTVEMTTVSDTMARYRLVDNLDTSLFAGIVDACLIVDGDQQNYSRICIVEDGTLEYREDMEAWVIVNKVRVSLKQD